MPDTAIEKGLELLRSGRCQSITEAARNAKCPRTTLSDRWKAEQDEHTPGKTEDPDAGTMRTVTNPGELPPSWTPESLAAYYDIDLDVWEPARIRGNLWGDPGDPRNQLRVDWIRKSLLVRAPDLGDWTPPPAPKVRSLREGESRKVVICGDHHCPHVDLTLHALFLEFLADEKPDEGVILGDLLDLSSISRHRRGKKAPPPDVNAGLRSAVKVLRDYRHASPDTRWTMLPGNHDDRLDHIQIDNAAGIYDVARGGGVDLDGNPTNPSISMRELLYLDELNIDLVFEDYNRAKYPLGRKLALRHGYLSGKGASTNMLNKISRSTVQGHCFDEATEILTPAGWLRHDELVEGQEVATLNRRTGLMEFQPTSAVYRYNDFTELVHVEGNNLDLAVTDEHGLWVGNPKCFAWEETTAKERFGALTEFRLAAPLAQNDINLSDAWVRLVAWIMAEGNDENARSDGRWGGCRISQSDCPDGRLQTLEYDVRETGIEFSSEKRYLAGSPAFDGQRNFDAYRLRLLRPSEWASKLGLYLTPDKTPTRLLAQMSARQAAIFLDTYVIADGHKNKHARYSVQLASVRDDHLDFLQELACRVGWRSCLTYKTGNRKTGWITINERPTAQIQASGWSRRPYSGTVWCCTVPNGTLVVRRGGKTAITLNTHRLRLIYKTEHDDFEPEQPTNTRLGAEAGCMAEIKDGLYYDDEPDWQQGALLAHVWSDHDFTLAPIVYAPGRLLAPSGRRYTA